MKYMILLMSNLIAMFTVKPSTLAEQLSSIQNYYGIEEEYQLTEENIHHIDSYKGWLAYYLDGEIYLCDDQISQCTESQYAFVLAHELYHHEQTLNIPTFEEDYTDHSTYYEKEADTNAQAYVKKVYHRIVSIDR